MLSPSFGRPKIGGPREGDAVDAVHAQEVAASLGSGQEATRAWEALGNVKY